jgi:hypothetical protein
MFEYLQYLKNIFFYFIPINKEYSFSKTTAYRFGGWSSYTGRGVNFFPLTPHSDRLWAQCILGALSPGVSQHEFKHLTFTHNRGVNKCRFISMSSTHLP